MMEQELTKFLTFWDHLNENEKELLKQNATFQTYAKGITMHRGSDDCLGVVLVRKGQLRTYMLSPDGRDITLYRLFAGDVCILSASCVLETITFDVFIDIEENSEIITITATLFQCKMFMLKHLGIKWQPIVFLMLCGRCSKFYLCLLINA